MPLINYAEVRQRISLERVLFLLGYNSLRKQGGHHYGRCPLGCSSDRRVCSFDLERGLWRCHKCQEGGNQLDLYAHRKSAYLYSAALLLCEAAGIPVPWLLQSGKSLADLERPFSDN